MKHSGKTQFGQWVWTKEEDDVVRRVYPDHARLQTLLRRRTPLAIKIRARGLGLGKPLCFWTANEITKFKRRYQEATKAELIAEFPRHDWKMMRRKAWKLGVRRPRYQPKTTGKPVLDQIRKRAADLRISLRDLDDICSSRSHFRRSTQCQSNYRNVWLRAIAALGGRVEIVWR